MNNALVFFVKYPQAGTVKTRLAKSVGDQEAARIYKTIAHEIYLKIKGGHRTHYDLWVVYDPPEKSKEIRTWLDGDFHFLPQQGDGLTQRLVGACKHVFEKGYASVVVIGSDTLDFKGSIVSQAFEQLQRHDLVIGPAKDGGYYLIGSKELSKGIFQDISWSTAKVLFQTLEKARALKLSYCLLEELEDLDEFENLKGRCVS